MVAEIRVYVEGGGDGQETKARVRRGFSEFFKDVVTRAREKRIGWRVVPCGSRDRTLDAFQIALRRHPDAFNIMLVDAEAPVTAEPRQHLRNRDGWDLGGVTDDRCHLMVQVVEAWLVADIEALQRYYGDGFNSNSIPRTVNVEQIDKPTLYSSLDAATRRTTKGVYHKIRHGPEILGRLDVSKVRKRAAHCERLFALLEEKVSG
jgi:hypothetical protein